MLHTTEILEGGVLGKTREVVANHVEEATRNKAENVICGTNIVAREMKKESYLAIHGTVQVNIGIGKMQFNSSHTVTP